MPKARDARIPVVVTKVARTERSKMLALSHSRALAGDDAVFDTVCRHYGAVVVEDLDQMISSAVLLSEAGELGAGDVGLVIDSGGLRELLIDLGGKAGVPFANLSPSTVHAMAGFLPPGLEATNPLDAAGPLTDNFSKVFERGIEAIGLDPAVSIVAMEVDLRDHFVYQPELLTIAAHARNRIRKPFLMINSASHYKNEKLAAELADYGVPWINGARTALTAIRACLDYRDFRQKQAEEAESAVAVPPTVLDETGRLLDRKAHLSEADALSLFRLFGLPVAPFATATSKESVITAAEQLGYPLVVKTANPDILHKSDVDGIRLNIRNADDAVGAFNDIGARLGRLVLLQRMSQPGLEIALGSITDPQYGPIVVLSAGGELIEFLRDRVLGIPPFGPNTARRLLDHLAVRPLFNGFRSRPKLETDAIADVIARFSVMVKALQDRVEEIDINPVIINTAGVTCVDGLVIPRQRPALHN